MAKRKSRSRPKRKIPLAATAGVVGALLPLLDPILKGDFIGAGTRLVASFTGMTPQGWNPAHMVNGVVPILAGGAVSMLAAKTGINRYLAGIPWVKV